MGWAKSQLFWKIVGLHALLSLLALIGLLVTLHARLSNNAAIQQQQGIHEILEAVRIELSATADIQNLMYARQRMVESTGLKLWLIDQNGRSLTAAADPPPADITLQSVVQSAVRAGQSGRRIRLRKDGPECYAFAISLNDVGSFESREGVPGDASLEGPASEGLAGNASGGPRLLLAVTEVDVNGSAFLEVSSAATQAGFFTWAIGVLCVAFVAAGLVTPLQAMSLNLDQSIERSQRDDMLLTISDRQDELGQVATSLHLLEEERHDRIEELQRAERSARSSVDLLRAVLDSMIEGVVAIDLEQRIVFLNTGIQRLLGISPAIGVGHRLYEAVRVPAFLETVREALTSRQIQTLEYRTSRDHTDLVLVVIPILKGPHPGAVAVVRDISEIRRLEAMRRDFVSGVSHELKTPLTVIQACTDTLLEGAMEDPVAAQRFLRQIEEQSERLLQLILGMLQLARVESGQLVLNMQPVDLLTVTDDVLRGFRTVAEKKSVKLVCKGVEDAIVLADEQSLQTILSNLVDNALKHTNPGGLVTVELIANQADVAVVVRDTGLGIPEELLGRIFERFYRVERDRSRERGGSGLGLAIVKHLCQAMGVRISVKSELGRGSEFRVELRRA